MLQVGGGVRHVSLLRVRLGALETARGRVGGGARSRRAAVRARRPGGPPRVRAHLRRGEPLLGGRVADLREDRDGVVHGVLFEIPVPARDAVLKKEGVATGLSQEIDVTVEVDGKPVQAKAFVARPERRSEPGPASGRLLQYLVEGAQERGLPQVWVDELKRHAAAADPSAPAPGPVGLKIEQKR